MRQEVNAIHEDNICLKWEWLRIRKKRGGVVLENWLENYNTLERYFWIDFREWLEFVEGWKWIVDRIVFQ